MNTEMQLRERIAEMLDSTHAHASFDDAVAEFPEQLRGTRRDGLPHSAWELLEHMRIAQWDILEFSRTPQHTSPAWPEGYWPEGPEPPDAQAWEASVDAFRRDLHTMQDLVRDPSRDLWAPFPHGTGQDLLREALLVADHNAYHLGQLIQLRRALGAWHG